MSEAQRQQSIEKRLRRAQEELFVALKVRDNTVILPMNEPPPLDRPWDATTTIRRLVIDGDWQTAAPAFRDIQEWVAACWNAERAAEAPVRTVITGDRFGQRSETQLDATTAARKLIVAAALYGSEAVAKYAAEFASHGMIELRSIYLLKGPSIGEAKRLDDYCSLLPYREALRRSNAHPTLPPTKIDRWPPDSTDNVCALESRSFERRTPHGTENELYTSPLLRYGLETLALVLGLVWGTGLRVFGSSHAVPAPAAAALPFLHAAFSGGLLATQRIDLALHGFGPNSKQRPLATAELVQLMDAYAGLSDQSRRVLALAMRRLCDSTARVDHEDMVVDVCIALEALFMDEDWNHKKRIATRGSWYFADSTREREQTRTMLKELYDYRSNVVHGNTPVPAPPEEDRRNASLFADAVNVVRASLKSMILEGRLTDWEKSKDQRSIRRDPPRTESEIPSVKSDSLSWSVKEQREIDRALEAVWKPTVDNAPPPPPDTACVIHAGLNPEIVEQCRQQGGHYVITHPARLYMAHPKWPKTASDPLDERTEYYCEKDVENHMQRWREAATEKRLSQFQLPIRAAIYHPRYRDQWARPLQ